MDSAKDGKEAALFPSMSPSTRIGVVGGGPSGLAAALALVKLGYRNVTVLEKHNEVGGMCGSEVVEGRVYDLGGQVIARESSPTLVSIMNELGVELEEMGNHTMSRIDCDKMKMEEIKIVADCLTLLPVTAKLQAEARATGKLGVHAVSDLAHEVSPQYLKSKGFENGVPAAVAALFTASGYGYPQDMPYAYLHEFVRSSLGQAWRVKGGYGSFWQKVATLLPDVRCNVQVTGIRRTEELVQVRVAESSTSLIKTLEFDKVIMSGSVSIPRGNRIYRSSSSSMAGISDEEKDRGILDYTGEELELFSKVETMDYYTTVMKISGLDIPAVFYYPEHADDPASMGRFVAMQRFYADTNIFLFWSYGTAEVHRSRVTELLYEDVRKMGGHVEALILQKKWRYFPHVRNSDMGAGYYDRLSELQGKRNTFYTGALMAFELTERNSTFSTALINKFFGSAKETFFVKRLIEYPLPNGAEEHDYNPKELAELPGLEFPDLPTIDAYVSFYANHPVTKDRVVYTWLDSQGKETYKLTYSQLDKRASIIAHHLLSKKNPMLKPGDRVVLLHPPGLEFIEAFLGCLRARILAVPMIPPDPTKRRGDQALEKLVNVVKITDARAILSTRAYHIVVRASSPGLLTRVANLRWPDLPWIHTNNLLDDRLNAVSQSWTLMFGLNTGSSIKGLEEQAEARSENREESESNRPGNKIQTTRIDGYCRPKFGPDLNEVCFLQFTSGSTGDAKGVMITHGALIHNVKSMRAAYKSTSRSIVASWLPQYHDMGLIGGLLVSMVTGGSLVIYSPITFIRNPMMWLETVEKFKVTHTAAPNFGFELILKRFQTLKATGRAKKLDLTSLRFLMVGAEPISSQTIKGFVEEFWDAGVREQIFAPGFGMAENCVFICCAFGRNRPILVDSQGRVGCGYTDRSRGTGVYNGSDPHSRKLPNQFPDSCSDVRIVDPETLEEVGDGVEGEIWVSSPSNGVGYWGMAEATQQAFGVHLNVASTDDARIKFMRSGDLGRVIQGNLFVTGRIKDLIIVNGRNHYPSDIEKTVENCSPFLRPGCSAAFSAPARVLHSRGVSIGDPNSDEAGIVVVVEVRDESRVKKDALHILESQIKSVVADEHGLQVACVNLLLPRTIPKTTSGKIRRRECLKRFSAGTLCSIKGSANLGVSRAHARLLGSLSRQQQTTSLPLHKLSETQPNPRTWQAASTDKKTKEEIIRFLVDLVAELSGLAASRISVTESFENYSIDSQGTVAAASKLSAFLNTHVSAIQIYTTGCISELAEFCYEVVKKADSRVPTGGAAVHTHPPSLPVSSIGSNTIPVQNQTPTNYMLENDEITEQISEVQLDKALEPSKSRVLLITALQIIGILYIGALLILPAVYMYEKLVHIVAPLGVKTRSVRVIILSAGLVPLAWICYVATAGFTLTMFGARILLPMNQQSKTAVISLWSLSYVRWWTAYRLQDFASTSLAGFLRGTVFLAYWYRLLGADIGDGVYLDTVDITDPSLLSIGSGSVIGEGATIQSHEVNAGVVRFQRVRIGRKCVVGPYSVIQIGSIMDSGSSLGALVKTEVGEHVPWAAGTTTSQVKSKSSLALAIGQLFGLYLVGLVSAIAAILAYTSFLWLASEDRMQIVTDVALGNALKENAHYGYLFFPLAMTFPRYLLILAPLMMFPEPAFLAELLVHVAKEHKVLCLLLTSGAAFVVYGATLGSLSCILKWIILYRVQTLNPSESNHGKGPSYRFWLVHVILRSTHEKFVVLLMGTEALCIYLRALGAKVGRMVSIRRLNALLDADILDLGDECHLGDFSKIITSQNLPGGMLTRSPVMVGSKSVVGAQSVVMPGSTLQQRSVLGAMSVAPSGAVLEEGGIYVGIKAPVRIYQSQQPNRDSSHGTEVKDQNVDATEHPLLAGVGHLDARFSQMIASVAAEFVKKTPAGHSRYIHKLGAAGKGTMRVFDNLPAAFPAHDILSPGATYPIVLRCSNGVSKDDDRCADVRGGTLRVLQPESPEELQKPLLDLFMKTGSIFHARNMVEFLGYYIMTEAERAERIRQSPALGESQWGNLRKPNSYAEMHYFACTTRMFQTKSSENMYVKFKIRPQDPTFGEDEGSVKRGNGLPPLSGMLPASPDDTRSKSCVRDDFKNRLESSEGVRFVLQLQLHPIPGSVKEQEEIQDPTKVWDPIHFPYMDVAELWLNEYIEDSVFDDIHFNPKNGPPSLAMIKATSAMQCASVDQGRSTMHDLLGYLRAGTPLPPFWHKLVKKSLPNSSAVDENKVSQCEAAQGCPVMSGMSNVAQSLQTFNQSTQRVDSHNRGPLKTSTEDVLDSRKLSLLRSVQPFLQVVAPFAMLVLALYPSILALAFIGSNSGRERMYVLVPVAYLCTGLLFAILSICCKWALSRRIKDGDTHELWSTTTLCHTVCAAINMTLASTFLELTKGSILCTWYLKGMGASIKDTTVYIDTLHALNPDQLEIGSRNAIGRNALLFGHLYEGKKVAFKSNSIGDDTFIGTRALILPGMTMEDSTQLPALGLGMKDEVIRAQL